MKELLIVLWPKISIWLSTRLLLFIHVNCMGELNIQYLAFGLSAFIWYFQLLCAFCGVCPVSLNLLQKEAAVCWALDRFSAPNWRRPHHHVSRQPHQGVYVALYTCLTAKHQLICLFTPGCVWFDWQWQQLNQTTVNGFWFECCYKAELNSSATDAAGVHTCLV